MAKEKLEKTDKTENQVDINSLIANLSPEQINDLLANNPIVKDEINRKATMIANSVSKHDLNIFPTESDNFKPRRDKTAVEVLVPGTGIKGKKPVFKLVEMFRLEKLKASGFILREDFEATEKGKNTVKMFAPDGTEIEVLAGTVDHMLKAGFTLEKKE